MASMLPAALLLALLGAGVIVSYPVAALGLFAAAWACASRASRASEGRLMGWLFLGALGAALLGFLGVG